MSNKKSEMAWREVNLCREQHAHHATILNCSQKLTQQINNIDQTLINEKTSGHFKRNYSNEIPPNKQTSTTNAIRLYRSMQIFCGSFCANFSRFVRKSFVSSVTNERNNNKTNSYLFLISKLRIINKNSSFLMCENRE